MGGAGETGRWAGAGGWVGARGAVLIGVGERAGAWAERWGVKLGWAGRSDGGADWAVAGGSN